MRKSRPGQAGDRSPGGPAGEMRFLKRIGVLRFRRLILSWEAFLHRRDGRRNANYHLSGSSAGDVGEFREYILYHVVLHLTGMLAAVLYFILRFSVFPASDFLFISDVFLGVLGLLHVYCLLLQRYTALLLRQYRERYAGLLRRRADTLREEVLRVYAGYDRAVRERDCRTLNGIVGSLRARRDVVLGAEESGTLKRLTPCLRTCLRTCMRTSVRVDPEKNGRAGDAGAAPSAESASFPGADPEKFLWPYGRTERRAARCAEMIGRRRSALLEPCAFVCACPEAEEAFCGLYALYGSDAADEADAAERIPGILEALSLCLNGIADPEDAED